MLAVGSGSTPTMLGLVLLLRAMVHHVPTELDEALPVQGLRQDVRHVGFGTQPPLAYAASNICFEAEVSPPSLSLIHI